MKSAFLCSLAELEARTRHFADLPSINAIVNKSVGANRNAPKQLQKTSVVKSPSFNPILYMAKLDTAFSPLAFLVTNL